MYLALEFGPADYFSLMVLGLVASVVLAQGSLLHAVGMVVLGLVFGLIGTDVTSGAQRYTFDIPELADGINFVTVAMGMFGLGEIIRNLESESQRSVIISKITNLMPTKQDLKRIVAPILRGTLVGSALGILPGSGSILGSFAAYSIEKKVSKNRDQFGKGAIEGVAAPESANNAGAQTSFIPMLTLGIPSNPVMALMVGAMLTGDPGDGRALIDLYRARFSDRCALTSTPTGLVLNPACPLVREHVCAAAPSVIALHLQLGRPAQADDVRRTAVTEWRCDIATR